MIVTAIAEAADVAPSELTPPLYDVVAPDAVETLFAGSDCRSTPVSLSFEYDDFAVTVVGEGAETIVDVQPLPAEATVAQENNR